MKHRLRVLFVGDADFAEFRQAFVVLQSLAQVVTTGSVAAAVQRLAEGWTADVMVLAQRRPGEFSPEAVDELRRLAPLAPVVALLGSLCEGESRSGAPCPGLIRVYWHQAELCFQRELSHLAEGGCPTWALPATATAEERRLHQAACSRPQGGVIAIQAECGEMRRWLADACRAGGYGAVTLQPEDSTQPIGGLHAAIWEGRWPQGDESTGMRNLIRRVQAAPLLAILDFPRVEDRDAALAAGAAAVMSKPVELDALLDYLNQVTLHQAG